MTDQTIHEKISDIKPIRDIIFEHLRQEFLSGHVKPGDRLIERDIAAKLNVSRTPVREALRKLESEGFVEYLPRKGMIVRGFNLSEIKEIYDIRKELECLAVRNAIQNMTEQDAQVIQGILRQLEDHEYSDQAENMSARFNLFDDCILNMAQMPMVRSFIGILRDSLTRYKKINLSHAPRRKTAIEEHKAILRAMLEKDIPLAEKLTIEHIENARKELLKHCQPYHK